MNRFLKICSAIFFCFIFISANTPLKIYVAFEKGITS